MIFDPDLDLLERLSNGALDLIEAGRLDEAERMCQELKRRFPDQPDWIERAALLHETRGELGEAMADYERLRGLACKSRP